MSTPIPKDRQSWDKSYCSNCNHQMLADEGDLCAHCIPKADAIAFRMSKIENAIDELQEFIDYCDCEGDEDCECALARAQIKLMRCLIKFSSLPTPNGV